MTTRRVYRYTTNVPIRHDDSLFRDQTDRMFRDMQIRRLTNDPHSFDSSFFHLNPRPVMVQQVNENLSGSREMLDDMTVDNLFVEDPQTKSRLFRMSFDVKKYDPKNIQVRVEDKCVVVEAKQEMKTADGSNSTSEFSRRIELPNDVQGDKLTSTLSSDGILTLQAPCPPKYQSMTGTGGPIVEHPVSITSQFQSTLPSQFQSIQPKFSSIPIQHEKPSCTTSGSKIIPVMPTPAENIPMDTPTFSNLEGGRRRFDLIVDLGRQYTSDNVVVKVDGLKLLIEATREEKDHGRVSRTTMQREFDLSEDIDPNTVQAMMKAEGQLAVVATTGLKK